MSANDGMAIAQGSLSVVFFVVMVEAGAGTDFSWLGQVKR